jgi:hypothetical protein
VSIGLSIGRLALSGWTLFGLLAVSSVGLTGCGNAISVDAFSAITRNTTPLPGRVYLVRGLIGDIFSLGMDELAEKIQRRGITASVHGITAAGAIASEIIDKYRVDPAPVMLIGHSSGGDVIIGIAERLKAAKVPVALAFGFDPTPIAGRIPSNVELFINLYQATNLIGGGTAAPETGFGGRLINIDLRERREILHITLDKSDVIHELVVNKILGVAEIEAAKRLAAKAPPPPSRGKQTKKASPPPPPPTYVTPLVMKYVVPSKERIEFWDSAIAVTVAADDTLATIAVRHSAPAWAIAQINKLGADVVLNPGRTLLIPRSSIAPGAASAMAAQIR